MKRCKDCKWWTTCKQRAMQRDWNAYYSLMCISERNKKDCVFYTRKWRKFWRPK